MTIRLHAKPSDVKPTLSNEKSYEPDQLSIQKYNESILMLEIGGDPSTTSIGIKQFHGLRVYQKNKTDIPSCPEEIRILKKISQKKSLSFWEFPS